MSELFTVTVDDRQVQVPKGTGLVEAGIAAGIEIPVFCYEPRLGAPVGACRMCLVEIEGMPKLQAGCTLTVTDGMVIRTAATSAKAAEGPGGHARVHPRQPPARLPGLRQGRRVPAPGSRVSVRAREHADVLPEADDGQAHPGVAAHRARPRALHPLLPLHALLGGRVRGRSTDRAQPRRSHRDRDVRGRAVPLAVLGQRDRAVPGRRADVHALPLRRAPVGHPERADGLHRLRGRVQRLGDDPRGEGQADPLAQPSGGRPGLDLRQGPVHVPAPAGGGPHHDAVAARAEGAPGGRLGRGARHGRGDAARGGRRDRDRSSRARRRRRSRTRSAGSCAKASARTRPSCRRRRPMRSRRSDCP